MNFQNPNDADPVLLLSNNGQSMTFQERVHRVHELLRLSNARNTAQNASTTATTHNRTYAEWRVYFAMTKILVALFIMIFTNTQCNQPLDKWLRMMMMYDFMVVIIQMLIKSGIRPSQNTAVNSQQRGYELGNSVSNASAARNEYNFAQNVDEESGVRLDAQNNNDSGFLDSETRDLLRTITIQKLEVISTIFYVFIFIYGQILYFSSDSNCLIVAPELTKVAYFYILIQYVEIGIPLVVVVCLILVLILALTRLSHLIPNSQIPNPQVPASNDLINNLPTKRLDDNLEGEHECTICMAEYTKDSEIIQLKCSPLHHFHASCIKEWLQINGVCPICRKKI